MKKRPKAPEAPQDTDEIRIIYRVPAAGDNNR